MWEPMIGSVGTLIGVLVTYLTFVKGRDREIQKEATEKANMSTQLQSIGKGVNEIKEKVNVNEDKMDRMNEKLIRIDESTKSAHKRIDNIVKQGRHD